ncbi:MAG TPA: hypothetical protein VMT28_17870 [Terriglobales bacterium]|nr:hypothetical protein [Terriglobales bacterium]
MTSWLDTRRVFVGIVALGLFAMAARPMTDPDAWWHLRTGQVITASHRVPHTDPYSYTRYGQAWVAHEWLSDVLIYNLYRWGGWAGLIVAFGLITAVTMLLVFGRCAGGPYIAGAMTVWAGIASVPSWGVRPLMLSLLLASIFLVILERSDAHPSWLWWMPPLTLLWVNLHGEYALGIALMGLFLAGGALDVAFGTEAWAQAGPRLRKLAIVMTICVGMVSLNPNGVKMYFYPFQTLRSPAMQKYIAEWASPNFHQARSLPVLLMVLATMVGLGLAPRRVRPREMLLLLVMTAAALRSVRHVPVYVLVAAPILSGLAQALLEDRCGAQTGLARRHAFRGKALVNAGLLAAAVIFAGVRVSYVVRHQSEVEAEHFPAAAVAFLAVQRPPQPLLNHYNWGGYLIWKLYPEYRVYIDGRADLYGDAFMDQFAATYFLTDHWRQELQRWQVRSVVLPPEAPLVTALRAEPTWKQIYQDSQAVVLVRAP